MTLQLYAEKKGWRISGIRTTASHHREPEAVPADIFRRRISIGDDLDDEKIARLLQIADRCPVHRTLTSGARIETLLNDSLSQPDGSTSYTVDMETLIAIGRGTYDAEG